MQQWPNCVRVGGACHQPHILCKPDTAIVLNDMQFQPPAQPQVAGQPPPSPLEVLLKHQLVPLQVPLPLLEVQVQVAKVLLNKEIMMTMIIMMMRRRKKMRMMILTILMMNINKKMRMMMVMMNMMKKKDKDQLIILKMIVTNMMKYMMMIMMMMNVILGSMIMIMMIRMMSQIHVKRGNVNRQLKKLRNVKPVNPQHHYENTKKVLRQ